MEDIEQYCLDNNLNFTPVRRKVLEILRSEKGGLGAYRILDSLKENGFNSQPPVAYRALDFLVEHGFVHKIESQNLFVACTRLGSHHHHSPVFLICKKCDSVSETLTITSTSDLSSAVIETGFKIEQTIIEAEGVCGPCSNK